MTKIMKKIFPWLLMISWMALIFYLSHQPAGPSSDLSSGVAELIMNFIKRLAPNAVFDFELCHFIIRKNTHFFAYLVLGVLTANAIRGGRKSIPVTVLVCVLYAIRDETHQIFIPGRAGQIMDELITAHI